MHQHQTTSMYIYNHHHRSTMTTATAATEPPWTATTRAATMVNWGLWRRAGMFFYNLFFSITWIYKERRQQPRTAALTRPTTATTPLWHVRVSPTATKPPCPMTKTHSAMETAMAALVTESLIRLKGGRWAPQHPMTKENGWMGNRGLEMTQVRSFFSLFLSLLH